MRKRCSSVRRNIGLRTALIVLLATVFAARALVPSGFMPDAKAGPHLAFVVCTAFGAKAFIPDDGTGTPKGAPASDHNHSSTAPCHFSLTGPIAACGVGTLAALVLGPPALGRMGPADSGAPTIVWPIVGTPRGPPAVPA